jgi:inner membrane protein
MDPLTHSGTGIFLGRAGLNRFCEQAPWILVLAANAPDIDVVTLFGGSLSYLNYHRHLTHSLIALPVMALLPLLAVRPFTRKPFRWRAAYCISFVAVVSHLLLDYTNVYGIRFLLPFSGQWFRLDLTPVVDLWIWAALLLALAGPLVARLVNTEIGARSKHPGRGFAIFALLFLLAYNAGREVLHARAVAMLDSRIYGGAAPLRVAALPASSIACRSSACWRNSIRRAAPPSIRPILDRLRPPPTARRSSATSSILRSFRWSRPPRRESPKARLAWKPWICASARPRSPCLRRRRL